MVNDGFGHIVGITDQICLEVGVKVLGDLLLAFLVRRMLLVSPSLVKLAIFVKPS